MFSQFKRYFIMALILIAISSNVPAFAAEWYEGGNLFTATLREWRKASQQNKLATCAEIISEVFLDNYFKLPFNETKLKEYSNQLLLAINAWAGDSNNDDAIVNEAALISMLQLEWIDENYLNFISKKTVNKVKVAPKPNKSGKLYEATLREWKIASQEDKLITSTMMILVTIKDNYFKLPVDNINQLKNYANQLLSVIDTQTQNNDIDNDNKAVVVAAVYAMIQLGWVDKSYLDFLYQSGKNRLNTSQKINPPTPSHKNETDNIKTSISSTSQKKINIRPKPKLMSKKAGKEWVKKNVHLRLHFPLEEMTARIGIYEAKSIGNIDRYYFPRINMTFFVIKSSQEFIGFSESEPSQKN